MVVVLPLLLILLFGHCLPTIRAGNEHGFRGVDMQSSVKPHAAACSGHSAGTVIPPRKGTYWVPLYRHLSPCSPASSTRAAKAAPSLAHMLHQDQLRVDHIHRRLSSSSEGVRVSKQGPLKEPVRSEVIHLHDQPVIQVTIGSERKTTGGGNGAGGQESQPTAGVVQTVVLDTASDVPWVQCHPSASATTDSSSSYDPARSGTYTALACNSQACEDLGSLCRGACVNNQCQYRVPIPSSPASSSSSGTYGSDLLALAAGDTANGAMTFRFGCSHGEAEQGGEGGSSFDNATAGVMALGGGTESLVSQTAATYGRAFSYCIPATGSREPGFFVLGGGGDSDPSAAAGYAVTPMLRYARLPTLYRVRLLAIAVDGQRLNVTPSVFAAGSVLDSRTAITRLPPTAYQALREAFRSRMGLYTEAPPQGSLDTCYDFSGAFFVMVPRIALLFDGNAVVELDRPAVLFHDCLAFTSNRDDRMPGILGNVQQQTMEVVYNVGGGSVGFRRGAC